MHSKYIESHLYEMDDLKRDASAARLFGSKCGYELVQDKNVLPCITGKFGKNI